jgi:hypothetical protein
MTLNIMNEYYWTTIDSNLLNNCTQYKDCSDNSNIKDCYLTEVCNNKVNSNILQQMVTTRTSSDGRFLDSSDVYETLLLNTLNLGIGVIILIALISKNV